MPGLVISLPSSPLSSSPARKSPPSHARSASIPHGQRTNTLTMALLPRSFFVPEILNIIRSHFDHYGEINQWVPLPGFGRILIVYTSEDDAESAKHACDPIVLQGEEGDDGSQLVLRVYRADPSPLKTCGPWGDEGSAIPPANYLRPPPIEKNFLISPPGSPPVGWEQIKEDPPNQSPLAEDLMVALRKLELQERKIRESGSLEVLLHPEESGVGVYVENCDIESSDCEMDDESWVYGETALARSRWQVAPTAMPPANSPALFV